MFTPAQNTINNIAKYNTEAVINFNETLSKIASFDFNKTSGTSAMTSFKRYTTNIDNKTKNILCLKLELTLNKLESNIEKVST